MPVTVSRSSEIALAFRLGVDDIKKLNAILSEVGDTFSYSIDCADGLTREFDNLEDLLEYENPPAKKIRDLKIKMRSKSYESNAEIKFSSDWLHNITVHLNGPEEIISKTSNELDDFFPRITTWYRLISRKQSAWIAGWFLSTVLIISIQITRHDTEITAETVFIYLALPGFMLIFIAIISRLQDWIFPMAEYAIGQGSQRDAYRERLRRGTVALIVLPALFECLHLLFGKLIG